MEGAKLVAYGTVTVKPNDKPGALGTAELNIRHVLKSHPALGARKVLELPNFQVRKEDLRDPPPFLCFFDVVNGRLEWVGGRQVKSAAIIQYLTGARAPLAKNRSQALLYYFRYLDHAEEVIASDAFLEFAKSETDEISQAARHLPRDQVRRLLESPTTPGERLSLFAFLLGFCGGESDAKYLQSLIEQPSKRTTSALDGILKGYILLRPKQGLEIAFAILSDPHRCFEERYSAILTLRVFRAWKPHEMRADVLRGLAIVLGEGDLADMAVEDLRSWRWWDLTPRVLALYGKKTHAQPIVRRSIIRYALVCPRPEAQHFAERMRREDPELIRELEEGLELEAQGAAETSAPKK
jgi:hypothetical protein